VLGKDALGRLGEELAARHLTDAGLQVLARNWRCREGEIDLVARDGDVLVFCEVKTRAGTGYGAPAEAVHPDKARRLRRLACRWLLDNRPATGGLRFGEVRFDVVAVLRPPGGPARIEHLRAAF
jgi:putative endonuclease